MSNILDFFPGPKPIKQEPAKPAQRLFVIAPSYNIAQHWAQRNGVGHSRFTYISQREQLLGISEDTLIVFLFADSRGYYDYSYNMVETILFTMSELEERDRIKVIRKQFEESL